MITAQTQLGQRDQPDFPFIRALKGPRPPPSSLVQLKTQSPLCEPLSGLIGLIWIFFLGGGNSYLYFEERL